MQKARVTHLQKSAQTLLDRLVTGEMAGFFGERIAAAVLPTTDFYGAAEI